jgi:long-chain fatty acid transport protein
MTADRLLLSGFSLLVFAAATLASNHARAAGFAIADQGASASGIANAATARFDLAETAFFNPAAMGLREPSELGSIGLGAALVMPDITHTSPTSRIATGAQTGTTAVPHLHANIGLPFDTFVSVYAGAPFGSGITWPEDWIGRFEVTQLSLRVFETGLNVGYAWRGDDVAFSVAAGPRLLLSDVELRRAVDAVDTEGDVRIVGDARSVSGQASLAISAFGARIGLNYRPRATLDYAGQADFSNIPVELAGRARDQNVATSVTLPDRIALGVAYDVLDMVTLSLDAEMFLWSTFEDFGIDFSADDTPDVSQPRNWSNTVALRFGAEFDPDLYGLRFRGGAAWDPTPSPTDTLSPTSPDSSRLVLTLGAGWRSDFGLGVNAAWGYVVLQDQESTGDAFPGEYSGHANVFNLGADFRF